MESWALASSAQRRCDRDLEDDIPLECLTRLVKISAAQQVMQPKVVTNGEVERPILRPREAPVRTRTAAQWDVLEASLVAVGADDRAGMREETEMSTRTNAGSRANVNREIRTLAATAGLSREWADSAIDRELTGEEARAAAFEAMRERGAAAAGIQPFTAHTRDVDDRYGRVRAMGEALFARVTPSHRPSDRARQYIGMTIPDLARECLRAAGVSTTGLSNASVIERAGYHSTSDFPQVLGDTMGRSVRAAYTAAPSALRPLARQRTATDFRMQHRLALSTGTFKLLKVNEAGEFKEGSLIEGGEAYKVDTFGRIFSISRQALVNDNLGAFSDLPRTLGQAAAALEADVLAGLVTGNPVMSDGNAVFSAPHANVGTPGAISLTSLSEARTAMRRQKGPGGEVLNVSPRFLVVPPELETTAEQYVAQLAAAEAGSVNPLAGKLTVVVEARLTDDSQWHVVADPASTDGLEYALLEGEDGPQTITEQGFDVDGVRIRVRHDFGGGWVDWRSWFRNPGA